MPVFDPFLPAAAAAAAECNKISLGLIVNDSKYHGFDSVYEREFIQRVVINKSRTR